MLKEFRRAARDCQLSAYRERSRASELGRRAMNRRSFFTWLSGAVATLFGCRIASPAVAKAKGPSPFGQFIKQACTSKYRLRIYESGDDWPTENARAICKALVPADAEILAESWHHFDRDTVALKVRHWSFDDCSASLTIPIFQMFASKCDACGKDSAEPETAAQRPFKWACEHCGHDMLSPSPKDGSLLVPPSLYSAFPKPRK